MRGVERGSNQELDSSMLRLFSKDWRAIVREESTRLHHSFQSVSVTRSTELGNEIFACRILMKRSANQHGWLLLSYLTSQGRRLTVCRCHSCGKKSFSQRGVCCWAPGPGSGPHPGAPSLHGSEGAPCSWTGCLDRGMRTTLCGLWDEISVIFSQISST